MEVVDSILKASGEYNIRDIIISALVAFYDVCGGESCIIIKIIENTFYFVTGLP